MGVADDQRRTTGLRARLFDRIRNRLTIVTVDLEGVPANSLEPRTDVLAERDVGAPVDRDVVVVVEVDEPAQPEMAGQRCRLGADSLHEVTVGDEGVGEVIHDLLPQPTAQMALGHRHADGRSETLAQRTRGHLDPDVVIDLGVSRGVTSPLTKVAEVVEGQREPGEMQQRVQQHRAVAVGEDEAIAIGPVR